jgi:plastocyanin
MRVRNKKNLSGGKMMIRKLCILLGLASGIITLLVACGTAAPASGVTTSNVVHMNGSNFVQSSITIKKGESVTLVADTLIPHIIANGAWENGSPKRAKEPGAPDILDVQVNGNSSQSIGPFTTAGTFKLYCTIHAGMNLTVVVQ